MAVAFGAGAGGSTSFSTTADTATFSVGSETDRALIAIVCWHPSFGETNTACAFDPAGANQAMTAAAAATTVGSLVIRPWYLVAPSNLATKIVRATFSDGAGIVSQMVYAAYYTGAHQTTPHSDWTTNSGSGTGTTVTVPNASTDDFIMDGFICQAGVGGVAIGANQTAIGAEQTPGDNGWSSRQDGVDGGVMSWTQALGGNWLTGGLRIVPSSGAAATWGPLLSLFNNRLVQAQ